MIKTDPLAATKMLEALLTPWYQAIHNPGSAQERILERLLKDYAASAYGRQHGAAYVETIEDYRRAKSLLRSLLFL